MPGSFFDSNVLLYLLSRDGAKAARAKTLVDVGGMVSVQVLNEMANVARRKQALTWSDTRAFLELIKRLLVVAPLDIETHEMGLDLAERHQLSVYDAMIVAAALRNDRDVLWSEDMQDGRRIERRLVIRNPFRSFPAPP